MPFSDPFSLTIQPWMTWTFLFAIVYTLVLVTVMWLFGLRKREYRPDLSLKHVGKLYVMSLPVGLVAALLLFVIHLPLLACLGLALLVYGLYMLFSVIGSRRANTKRYGLKKRRRRPRITWQ